MESTFKELLEKWDAYRDYLRENQRVRDEERYLTFRDFVYWIKNDYIDL